MLNFFQLILNENNNKEKQLKKSDKGLKTIIDLNNHTDIVNLAPFKIKNEVKLDIKKIKDKIPNIEQSEIKKQDKNKKNLF